jgi:hypothetical protein
LFKLHAERLSDPAKDHKEFVKTRSPIRCARYDGSAVPEKTRPTAGYIRRQLDDPLLIVIGDHQPPAVLSGASAPWEVPVHVIGRRAEVLDRLIAHGFRPGLAPARPSIGPMHTLVPVFLDVFSEPD